MKANLNINKGLVRCFMALGGLLAASCGSYESTSYHDRRQTAENGTTQTTASGLEYQNYFGSLKEDYQVLTDVDNYSSNDSVVVVENGYAARPAWGSNPDNVTINIYDNSWGWNSWYGPGWGWGWNYGWGWNSWYGPGWGWGWNSGWGWNAGWAWGGYYGPYWGGYYPYYGGYGHYYPYRYNTPRGYNSPYYATNGGRRVYTAPGGRYGRVSSDYATGRRIYSTSSGRGVRTYNTGRTYSTSTGTRNNSYTPATSGTRNNSTYTPSRNSSSTRSYSPPASGGRSSGGSYGGGSRGGGGGGGRSGGGGGRR